MTTIPGSRASDEASDTSTKTPAGAPGGRPMRVVRPERLAAVLDLAVADAVRKVFPRAPRRRLAQLQELVREEFFLQLRQQGKRVRGISRRRFLLELQRSKDLVLETRDRARAELEALELTAQGLRARLGGALTSRRAFEEELDRYERRIHKLSGTLERTEAALAELARAKQADDGLASIYRTVQGLADDVQDHALKRGLLAQIYEANLHLRREIAERAT